MAATKKGMPTKIGFKNYEPEILETESLLELNYLQVTTRRQGLLFRLGNYRYLYEYSPCDVYEFDETVHLIDKIFIEDVNEPSDDDQLSLNKDEFKFVDIIQTTTGYVLSEIFNIDSDSVSGWVDNNFPMVFERVWERFKVIKDQIEDLGNCLE